MTLGRTAAGLICMAFVAFVLTACRESTETPLAGSGNLVLTSESAAVVTALDRDVGQIRFQRFIAVDASSGAWGATFCEENAPAECIPSVDGPPGSDAVRNCRENGGQDCRVLYSRGEIIWDGSILRRSVESDASIPYHGAWPVEMSWPDKAEGSGRLIADQGVFLVEGFRPLGACEIKIGWTKSEQPAVTASCKDGSRVSGLLQAVPSGGLEMSSRSSTGDNVRLFINLGQGTALPVAYRKFGSS